MNGSTAWDRLTPPPAGPPPRAQVGGSAGVIGTLNHIYYIPLARRSSAPSARLLGPRLRLPLRSLHGKAAWPLLLFLTRHQQSEGADDPTPGRARRTRRA